MANLNGLFDLTGFESKQDNDILDMNINEEGEFDNTDDIEEILEATRYNLEVEKELDKYKTIWNSCKKYNEKLSELHDKNKSSDYNQKIDKILKDKEDEVNKAHSKLIDTYGDTLVMNSRGVVEKLSSALKRLEDNPNDIDTKKSAGNNRYLRIGRTIKNQEYDDNYQGAQDSDGSVKPGRYNMKESADEFADNDPSTNNPEEDFDTNATSAKETKIPVPSKVILSQDTYNDALSSLKKSFKEGYEIMELLEQATVQAKTTADLQREFTENAIAEAQYESMISGPIFEAVERSDKKNVKAIIKNLFTKVEDAANDDNVIFYKPAKFIRLFTNIFDTFETGPNWVNTWTWQILGAVIIESGNVQEYTKNLTKRFANELGDYKILAVRIPETISDKFREKFGWKNHKRSYLLLIDKKLNSEIKNAIAKLETKSDEKDDKNCKDKSKCKNKKNEVVTESVYDYDYDDE